MMWKTLIFLALASVVIAGKINNKRNANYAFHIKHDYDYLKRHEKLEHHEEEAEEKPQEEQVEVVEQQEEKKEEVEEEQPQQNEEPANEPEQTNEGETSEAEPEETQKEKENEYRGYEFFYKVLDPYTHDKKGQHEKKYGGEIKGVYWLLQPDGYKRTVDYHVDKHNGFHAKVDYSKLEEPNDEEENSNAKSEYYVKTYHEHEKYIPVIEEQEQEDRQEESAQHIPIYVI